MPTATQVPPRTARASSAPASCGRALAVANAPAASGRRLTLGAPRRDRITLPLKESPMKLHGLLFAGLLATTPAFAAGPAPTPLAQLYASYEKAEFSTLSMPEYDQRVRISATVLEQNESLGGDALTSATDGGDGAELARLTADDEAQAGKLASLEPGAKFVATCTVGFTSGSDYLSLESCSVE